MPPQGSNCGPKVSNHEPSNLATLQSLMVSCQDIIPWSRFHLRPLQILLLPYLHLIERENRLFIALPTAFLDSLAWWLEPGRMTQRTSLAIPFRKVVMTDASLLGWGAHLEGETSQIGLLIHGPLQKNIASEGCYLVRWV